MKKSAIFLLSITVLSCSKPFSYKNVKNIEFGKGGGITGMYKTNQIVPKNGTASSNINSIAINKLEERKLKKNVSDLLNNLPKPTQPGNMNNRIIINLQDTTITYTWKLRDTSVAPNLLKLHQQLNSFKK